MKLARIALEKEKLQHWKSHHKHETRFDIGSCLRSMQKFNPIKVNGFFYVSENIIKWRQWPEEKWHFHCDPGGTLKENIGLEAWMLIKIRLLACLVTSCIG